MDEIFATTNPGNTSSMKVLSKHFSKAKSHLELFSNNKWHKEICSDQPIKMLTRETFFKQQTLVQRSENVINF